MSRSASHIYEPPVNPPAEPARAPRLSAVWPPLVFDRAGIRELDSAAIEEFGIPGIVLMENAARGVADEAMRLLDRAGETAPFVLIVCGSGNNGGDGYAIARHLHNRGVEVALVAVGEPSGGGGSDAAVNRAICRAMQLRFIDGRHAGGLETLAQREHISLIIDAIFGTGLDREVSGVAAEVIKWINRAQTTVLAVDLPSGMDCDRGTELGVAVQASRTATLVGPKIGFAELHAQYLLGEVSVVDIGVPRELAERFGQPARGGRGGGTPHPEGPEHESESGQGIAWHRRPGE